MDIENLTIKTKLIPYQDGWKIIYKTSEGNFEFRTDEKGKGLFQVVDENEIKMIYDIDEFHVNKIRVKAYQKFRRYIDIFVMSEVMMRNVK